MQNQHTPSAIAATKVSQKQAWSTPGVQDLNPGLIQQQEEEELIRLLSDENAFRLLNGSVQPSDYRLKEDAQEFTALELVNRIQVYDYAWKANGNREYGVMAHELQAELPYLVTGQKDEVDENGQPLIQRVNYAKLVPVLLRAIQEQHGIIKELKILISALYKKSKASIL